MKSEKQNNPRRRLGTGPLGGFVLETLDGAGGVGHGALRSVLRVAGLGFRVAILARKALYRCGIFAVHRAPCPVISVGNITAGGTGKTPAAWYLMRLLESLGRKPALLCRGYGAASTAGRSDEVAEYGEGSPVFASPDRVASSREALAAGADCLVLDDGFQHLRMARDLDILLVDVLDPFGGGWMLPAGYLREPVSAAGRASLAIITRCDLAGPPRVAMVKAELRAKAGMESFALARHAPSALEGWTSPDPGALKDIRVGALSGIGNPEAFTGTLVSTGAVVAKRWDFPDHHDYTLDELGEVASQAAAADLAAVVTTGKDWGKIRDKWPGSPPLACFRVIFEVVEGADLVRKLLEETLAKADKVNQDPRGERDPGAKL